MIFISADHKRLWAKFIMRSLKTKILKDEWRFTMAEYSVIERERERERKKREKETKRESECVCGENDCGV